MAITYQIIPCTNPRGAEGVDYACDARTKTGDYTTQQLVDDLNEATSVTKGDVLGILKAYLTEISRWVREGNTVEMEGLGTFRARLSSKCFPQSVIGSDDFDPSGYIRSAGIAFRPAPDLKAYVRARATYRRVPSQLMG